MISTNNSSKQFIKTKKANQANTISFVSPYWNHQKDLQQFNQAIITMGVHIEDNKLAATTELKTFNFDLPKNVDNNLKHEINSIILS